MTDLATLRRDTAAVLCTACAKCATSCPLGGFGGFSPVRMIVASSGGHAMDLDQALIAQRCLTCEACEVRCPQGVHVAEFARGLRESIPDGLGAPCPHGSALQAAARLGLAAGSERDLSWLDTDLRVAETGPIAVFVGCLPLFDAYFGESLGIRMTDIAQSAIRALNQLGIAPVLISDERCCGHDQLWSGDRDTFTELAGANAGAFRERGVETVLTTCAECCRTWRMDYPEAVPDYRPKVQHLVEFLDERLQAGELTMSPRDDAISVTYQDPCRLGRHLGVFDAPRRVLGAIPGLELVEMERSGADAACCGTAGFMHCDAASRSLQTERLAEAVATGAATLLTACPKCLIHLTCAQVEDRRVGLGAPQVNVEDLTVLTVGMIEMLEEGKATKERTGAVI